MSTILKEETEFVKDEELVKVVPPCIFYTECEGECKPDGSKNLNINILNTYSLNKKTKEISQNELSSSNSSNIHLTNQCIMNSSNVEETQENSSSYPMTVSSAEHLKCDSCMQSFLEQNDLNLHQEMCGSLQNISFSCNICNITFNSKKNLDNHLLCHESEKQYPCKSCGRTFKLQNEFQTHSCIQKHLNLICSACGTEFSKMSSLKNHMKIHNYLPGREFVAPTFCETILSDNCSWANEIQPLPPLMPQLEMVSNADITNWNLSDSVENKDLNESMNMSQEMTPNTYTHILDSQTTFHNELDSIEEVSAPTESLDHKNEADLYFSILKNTDHKDNLLSSNLLVDQNIGETKKKPHTCKYCGVSFTREKALVSHERFHLDYLTDILECKKCGEIFLKKDDLKMHSCSKNSNKISCDISNSTIENNNLKNVPKPSRKETPGFVICENENIEYPQKQIMEPTNPTSSTLKQSKHTCEHCFKRFTTKQKKFRHMWIHRSKTFSCEICSESFTTQLQLNEHRLTSHEGNTPHGCVICGKCFASRQGLWEHMRLHKEGSAPHQCNLCGKKFTSRQGYHIHVRTHTGERPYGCRYCWKAFRDGGTLRKHERIHTGERPHVCPICHRAFNQKVVLREHVRWLHAHIQPNQNQPFIQCPIANCKQTLTDKEDLCAHIVKHSDTLSSVDSAAPNLDVKIKPKRIKKEMLPKHSDITYEDEDQLYLSPDHKCEMCGEIFPVRDLLLSHIKVHI